MSDYGSTGPFDSQSLEQVRPYVDLGALRIEPRSGLSISVSVDEQSSRIVAVTLDLTHSKLEVMAFAAPKSDGIWSVVRASIANNIVAQGGQVEETVGPIGVQLEAKLPLFDEQGRPSGFRLARYIGFDGPRWCLRGTVGGAALTDLKAEAEIIEVFRSIVVHRGDDPLPPNEPLPLTVPSGSVVPPSLKQS